MTVNCKICGQHFSKTVSANHLKKHGISRREYQEKYQSVSAASAEVVNKPRTRPVRQSRPASTKPVATTPVVKEPTMVQTTEVSVEVAPVVQTVTEVAVTAPVVEKETLARRILRWIRKIFGVSDK